MLWGDCQGQGLGEAQLCVRRQEMRVSLDKDGSRQGRLREVAGSRFMVLGRENPQLCCCGMRNGRGKWEPQLMEVVSEAG